VRQFTGGTIEGMEFRRIGKFGDERGWVRELFRSDDAKASLLPAMCYASLTRPGVTRGPHEHSAQTDWFCFFGPSNFLVVLWDNRLDSPTYNRRMRMIFGEDASHSLIVPPGVVHGYRNVGDCDGLVINLPNRLYMGSGRLEPVDEIRHESDPKSPFKMDGP
jgi:dTDP-4-dehydrorhamnose 3,5-epimerase